MNDMVLIEIDSLKRSGHHGFAQWLISNLHEHPFNEKILNYKYNHVVIGDKNILWVNEGFIFPEKTIEYISEQKSSINAVIITYEVPWKEKLEQPNHTILTGELKEKWGVKEHIRVSFVRDILNNLSSLKKMEDFSDEDIEVKYHLQIYKNQLKKALTPFEGIIYDRWISDEEYANQVCLKILGKNNMFHPLEIGGTDSSFDGKLNVQSLLDRYKQFPPPQWTIELIKQDKELMEMLGILGMNKPTCNPATNE